MNCNSPYLRTHEEIVEDIKSIVGFQSCTEGGIHGALARAMRLLGNSLKACFCIDLNRFECGKCEYPLPECAIDDIEPEVACYSCGCDEGCYHRLSWWELKDNRLVVPRDTHGYGRATVWVRNPDPLPVDPSLAVAWRPGLDIILDGKVENIPPYGWMKLGEDWVQYHGVSYEVYQADRIPEVVRLDDSLNYDSFDTVTIREDDVLRGSFPANCFVTRLKAPSYHCNGGSGCTHPAGATLKLGVAVYDPSAFDAIVTSAAQQFYLTQMTQCAGSTQREISLQMLEVLGELAGSQQRSFRKTRKPKVKYRRYGGKRMH